MCLSLTYKILQKNLIFGNLIAGEEIKVKVNQTLTQDSTGTMVYLQLNELCNHSIKTDLSVAYIDHNTLQNGFENADDHEFIRTSAAKHGIIFSKAGNGICHQVHLERFTKPNALLLGSDSHTPTCGGLGMLAIGAGGLDVAVAMSNGFYTMKVPKVYNIRLSGKLNKYSSAKDIILYILKKLTVKGGFGYVLEYSGEGLSELSVTDRATIANMGAELGATTSIFPSDENTKDYLYRQNRSESFEYFYPDSDVIYDNVLDINLAEVLPMIAKPHSPDNVVNVTDVEGTILNQVAIGSCTNSSYSDLMEVANILKGKTVAANVSLVISPGSSSILKMLADNGALGDLIASGARILEASCGPCIGMGQAPKSNGVSLRTFNRNFKGRCGTSSADVYIASPATAALSALKGYITSPESENYMRTTFVPEKYDLHKSYFIYPDKNSSEDIVMGPNIKPFPLNSNLLDDMSCTILLKTSDNITTDDIVPSGAHLLPYRSNIPKLSEYCFKTICDDFYDIAIKNNGGIIIGGDNYGQGSSREHAALVPLFLGVKAVFAKSFARIHKSNLINSGILPLIFSNLSDYNSIEQFDHIVIKDLISQLENKNIQAYNETKDIYFTLKFEGSSRDIEVLKCGGYINFLKKENEHV